MPSIRLRQRASPLACAVLILLLTACAASLPGTDKGNGLEPPAATPPGQAGEPQGHPDGKQAQVESVSLRILESFPVQIHALVRGHLADGCTEIDQIESSRDLDKKAFEVSITTVRPADKICSSALVPFEETIPLDVRDLPAGTYTVDVNGVQGSFELQMDNSLS